MKQIIKDVKKANNVLDLEKIFSDYEFYSYIDSGVTNDYINICFRDEDGQKYSVECKDEKITVKQINRVEKDGGVEMKAIKI